MMLAMQLIIVSNISAIVSWHLFVILPASSEAQAAEKQKLHCISPIRADSVP